MEQGLYQRQLAQRVGVDEMTIVNWEKDRTVPNGMRLERLAGALGVEIGELGSVGAGKHGLKDPYVFVSTE